MEIKEPKDQQHMRDYWPRYRRRIYIALTAIHTILIVILFGALELSGVINLGPFVLFCIILGASVILSLATILLVRIYSKPFRDLLQAVILISGEQSAETPVNPNIPRYEKDGFRDILQTVYELGARREISQINTSSTVMNDILSAGLNGTSTGIVILNADQKVAYHNSNAPVRVNPDESLSLDVQFPQDDTLEQWLQKISKNKLAAERHWMRVANRLPGEKDRQIYDITASYHKDSSAETVITLVNRTRDYLPEEDELDFISFAAHELRGPITVIRGYLDVLHDELHPVLEKDQAELMERLIVTSNRLSSYVNNILNASKYDRRHLRLHLSEVTLKVIYSDITDDMQLRASAQNRLLVVDFPDTLPTVAADSNAVGEALGNLIDNAIKYSNEGGLVHVTAHVIPGFVEVSVIDHGIGMPVSVIPNLFHKFYRSHRSRETVAGTGIGLYISKAIISSHGGLITARSIENEGSTFSFTLPIYDTVASKLKAGNNNQSLIEHTNGSIRNHSMYRG